jgi:hypothetical protein
MSSDVACSHLDQVVIQLQLHPGASHTGGIDAPPREYARRVIAFFDAALLGKH